MYSTGMEYNAESTTFCEVTSLHLRGAVGQQENMVRGFALTKKTDGKSPLELEITPDDGVEYLD